MKQKNNWTNNVSEKIGIYFISLIAYGRVTTTCI